MKFHVTKHYKETIAGQMGQFEKEGIISSEQKKQMMDTYEVREGVNLTRIVSVVGAVLVGLGILTYIAGNWSYLSPNMRMFIIAFGITSTYLAGLKMDVGYPKTARAMRYISIFIFGGGLFLTDQTYHLNRPVAFHFLIWAAGVMVMLYTDRDNLLLYFFQAVLMATAFSLFDTYRMTDSAFMAYYAVLAAGVFLSVRLTQKNFNSAFSVTLSVLQIPLLLLCLFAKIEIEALYGSLLILLLGAVYMAKPDWLKGNDVIVTQVGLALAGIAGFVMTFADTFEGVFPNTGEALAIGFTVLMLTVLLYLVKKGYAGAVAFIALVILRYYFDTFYDFLPKSMFFVIGGGILIGFGIYLESLRRKGLRRLE